MGTLVNYMTEKGVAVLTLNDPPVNAYSYEMLKELDGYILKARFDNDVHVIVITGHGEKFFCAGANINMLREADTTFKYYFCLHANETLTRLEQTPEARHRRAQRPRVGGGLEIALACDMRIARAGDFQLGLPEVALGVLPGTGGTQRLARLVGKSRAIELMVEGATMNVNRAAELGLVNKVWSAESTEEFIRKVIDYAPRVLPAERRGHGRRPHQARRPERARDEPRAGPRLRARAPGRALRVRRREGRPERLRREAEAAVPRSLEGGARFSSLESHSAI